MNPRGLSLANMLMHACMHARAHVCMCPAGRSERRRAALQSSSALGRSRFGPLLLTACLAAAALAVLQPTWRTHAHGRWEGSGTTDYHTGTSTIIQSNREREQPPGQSGQEKQIVRRLSDRTFSYITTSHTETIAPLCRRQFHESKR